MVDLNDMRLYSCMLYEDQAFLSLFVHLPHGLCGDIIVFLTIGSLMHGKK